jgi:hypothetical protein
MPQKCRGSVFFGSCLLTCFDVSVSLKFEVRNGFREGGLFALRYGLREGALLALLFSPFSSSSIEICKGEKFVVGQNKNSIITTEQHFGRKEDRKLARTLPPLHTACKLKLSSSLWMPRNLEHQHSSILHGLEALFCYWCMSWRDASLSVRYRSVT